MNIGVSINASLIFSILTTLFLIILIHTENVENLFAILIKIPYSKERIAYEKIKNEIQGFLMQTELSNASNNNIKNTNSLKSLTTSIENIIVEHTVELAHGSQVHAANLLGVSASSICRKKRKDR